MTEYDVAPGYAEETVSFDAFKSEEDVTSPEYPKEGIYHVSLNEVDCSGKHFPGAVFMVFEIFTGNIEGQQGKIVRYVVWPVNPEAKNPDAAAKAWKKTLLQLMLAFGLREKNEFPKELVLNEDWWNALEGKQCIIKVTHVEESRIADSGKEVKWTAAKIVNRTDIFPIGDDAVKNVPIDEEAASIAGYGGEKAEESID